MRLPVLEQAGGGPAAAADARMAWRRWVTSSAETVDTSEGTRVIPMDPRDTLSRALWDGDLTDAYAHPDFSWVYPRTPEGARPSGRTPAGWVPASAELWAAASHAQAEPVDPPPGTLLIPARSAYGLAAASLEAASRFDLLTRLDDPSWDVLCVLASGAGRAASLLAIGGVYACGDVGLIAGVAALAPVDAPVIQALVTHLDGVARRASYRRMLAAMDATDDRWPDAWRAAGYTPAATVAGWRSTGV